MNISYDKTTHQYRLGNETFTKEAFISYIQSDMLQAALATKAASFDITEYTSDIVEGGKNIIIAGAPGTGKSHDTKEKYAKNSIRCIFHNDYTNSDFIGTYRPVPLKSNETDSINITYQFVPGPFTKALVNAYNKTDEMHNLIIEEINRANASAVFGEIFQLLDRNKNGTSEYPIDIYPEMQQYLTENISANEHNDAYYQLISTQGQLVIPSNLNIIATMNTSDQGVFTLDTAFKRRWIFQFKDIDFSECDYKDTILSIGGENITWSNFAQTINSFMLQNNLPEDRQLGPFFLKENELNNEDIFCSKLLYYIWTDAAKYNKDAYFKNINSFSELTKNYKEGLQIFSTQLYEKLKIYFV